MRPLLALFARSMREQTRHKFTPFARAGLVLVILLLMLSFQTFSRFITAPGRHFFSTVMSVNFFFIAVAVVSTFSSVITEEKEDDTLGLLRMTNLSPVAILLGKSTSRLCGVLLLLAAQFPFTILAIAMGGISLRQIIAAYAILASTIFFLSNLALYCSVVSRSNRQASRNTFAYGFLLYAILPMVCAILQANGWLSGAEVIFAHVVEANPVVQLQKVMGSTFAAPVLGFQFWSHLIGGVVFFLLAWGLFDRFCSETVDVAPKKIKGAQGLLKPRRFDVGRPGRRALMWKDFHFFGGGKKATLQTFAFYVLALVALNWLMPRSVMGASTVLMGFGMLSGVITLMIISLRMFGREQKERTLSSLVVLPISTGQILWQKCLAAFLELIPSLVMFALGLVLSLPSLVYMSDSRGEMSSWIVFGFVGSLLQLVLFLVLLMNFSLRFRRAAFPAAVAVMFVLKTAVGILSLAAAFGRWDPSLISIVSLLSGVLYLVLIVLVVRSLFTLIAKVAAEEA